MADPVYSVRGSFSPATWQDLASHYTWGQLAATFTWADLSTMGGVPDKDVLEISYSRKVADLTERMEIGQADIVLDNERGVYSPDRGLRTIRPNQPVAIKATYGGSVHNLFTGFIDRLTVQPELGGRKVTLSCSDIAKRLRQTVSVPIGVNTRTTSLFTDIMTTAGIAVANRDIALVDDPIPAAYLSDITGGDALDLTMRSGAHYMAIPGNGKLTVRDRNFDMKLTTVASYSEYLALSYRLDEQSVFNDVRVTGEPRKATTDIRTIAWLDEVATVPGSSAIRFTLEYVDPDTQARPTPANSVVTPVASIDYIFNVQEDSSGLDLTTSLQVAVQVFATTAEVTVTNPNGTPARIVMFNLRGASLQKQPQFTAKTVSTDSQSLYGVKINEIQNDVIPTPLFAQGMADYLISTRKNPQPEISFRMKNEFPDLLKRELLERVHLVESLTGINSNYLLIEMDHAITFDRGLEHAATYRVRLSDQKSYFILDNATAGTMDTDHNLLGF